MLRKMLVGMVLLMAGASVSAEGIALNKEMVRPILNGQKIPDVEVQTANGNMIKLKDLVSKKPTILFFYRGGWCFFCSTQLGQLRDVQDDLTKLGYQLVGISTDSPEDLQSSIKDKELDYMLLSDYRSFVSQKFGLAYFASDKTTKRYLDKYKLQNPLQTTPDGESRLILPAPAVYIIDQKGLVQFQYVNPNYKVRLDPEILLKAAEVIAK